MALETTLFKAGIGIFLLAPYPPMTRLRSILSLDAFVKTLSENDLAKKQQLRLFKITSIFGFIVFSVIIGQLAMLPVVPVSFLTIFCVFYLALFINYFVLAIHKNAVLSFTLLLLICFSMLHLCSYGQGGIRNSGLLYLASLILVAYLMLGKRGGMTMVILSIAHIIYFYVLSFNTNWVDYSLIGTEPGLIDTDFLVTGCLSILLLSALSNFVEKSKSDIIDDIISKKNELAAKNERLEKSEQTLNRINQQYARKNSELEQKNKELAEFNFVATHDLQEPMGTTANFVELLQKEYRHQLDGKGARYLEYIAQASARMKVQIRDLIDYSMIGRTGELAIIDCNILFKEVVAEIGPAIRESNAKISSGKLPSVIGYEADIKLLFHSLLLNAIKFKRTAFDPRINISAERRNDDWVFAVRDNGIGIPKEHHERIFSLFQRLHTRETYRGSGVGLSHCKKIVLFHNGEIWLDSVPGEGSTFYFSLPAAGLVGKL